MSGKKNSKAIIDKLIADNKWEQVQRERDDLKVEKIRKLGERSKVDVLIGGLLVFAAYSSLLDLIKIMRKNAKDAGADNFRQLIKGFDTNELGWIALLMIAGLIFFFFALRKYEVIDKLTSERYIWMPDEAEAAFIDKRFDNDFIRSILSKISSDDTRSIEVGLDAVKVNNSIEPSVFNYKKSGFNRLTNYDTKQLAFYLASHSFPEGFSIHQTKITPEGSEKFIGGVTYIGIDLLPKEDEERHRKKLLARLYEQLREFARIRNPFAMYLKEPGPGAANNGQIVLNKGFRGDREGYADL